jgi:hypothetical protein
MLEEDHDTLEQTAQRPAESHPGHGHRLWRDEHGVPAGATHLRPGPPATDDAQAADDDPHDLRPGPASADDAQAADGHTQGL